VVVALLIPAFDLQATLRGSGVATERPVALAPDRARAPVIGAVNAVAQTMGLRPGMRIGEALATCPELVLLERDPAGIHTAWEEMLLRLEGAGFAVEPLQPGTALVETVGVERLYGGLEAAISQALAVIGPDWDARAGAATRRFAALAAASVARPGQMLIISKESTSAFLEPLPLTLLPLEPARYAQLESLGLRTIGELARLPAGVVSDRLGPDGRRAWGLAHGERDGRVAPRRPPRRLIETFEFPDPVGEELTLRRALGALIDRLVASPERSDRPPRKLALWALVVGGGSWRRTVTLREPTADPDRLRLAIAAKLAELPCPVLTLRLEVVELAEHCGEQLELVPTEDGAHPWRLREGLRQVRAAVGAGGVSTVVEVAPWSRIPETRVLLVPRDD